MLLTGRGDLIGYPELVMYHTVRKTGLKPENAVHKTYCFSEISELYAAFSLRTPPEMVTRFQIGLKTIKTNDVYQKILAKYLN